MPQLDLYIFYSQIRLFIFTFWLTYLYLRGLVIPSAYFLFKFIKKKKKKYVKFINYYNYRVLEIFNTFRQKNFEIYSKIQELNSKNLKTFNSFVKVNVKNYLNIFFLFLNYNYNYILHNNYFTPFKNVTNYISTIVKYVSFELFSNQKFNLFIAPISTSLQVYIKYQKQYIYFKNFVKLMKENIFNFFLLKNTFYNEEIIRLS